MHWRDRPEPPPPTERLPFGTTAVKTGEGTWNFDTEGFVWMYKEQQGFNLGLHQPTGEYTFQLHAPNLRDAVVYAWGFTYGWKGYRDTFREELKEIRDKAESLKARYERMLEELREPSPAGA